MSVLKLKNKYLKIRITAFNFWWKCIKE